MNSLSHAAEYANELVRNLKRGERIMKEYEWEDFSYVTELF